MSEYGQGTFLLRSILDSSDLISFLKLKDRALEDEEKDLYRFIRRYYSRYKKLPNIKTCLSEGFSLPEATEPVAYYKQKLLDRYVVRRINDNLNSDTLIEKDEPEDMIIAVREFLNDVSDLNVTDRQIPGYKAMSDVLKDLVDNRAGVDNVNIKSGWALIDELMNGYKRTDLIGLIAYTNAGKTFCLIDLAVRAIRQNKKAVIVTTEMSVSEVTERLAAMMARVPYHRLVNYTITSEHEKRIKECIEELNKNDNLHIIRAGFDYTLDDYVSDVTKLNPDVAFIDGIADIAPDSMPATSKLNQFEQEAKTFNRAKDICKELEIPIIYTEQLKEESPNFNKKGKNTSRLKSNNLDSVAGSKKKSRVSDIIITMYTNPSNPDQLILKLSKSRRSKVGAEAIMDRNFNNMQFMQYRITDDDIIDGDDDDLIEEDF